MDKKIIDDIVWYIPFKKLRNALREYLIEILNNLNNDNIETTSNDDNIIGKDIPYYSKPIEEYYFLSNRRKEGIEKRKSYDIKDDKDIDYLLNYNILHKLKEIDLKNKIKNGKKVRVCFLLDEISKLYFESIYYEMKNTEFFEPFIYFISYNSKLFNDNTVYQKKYIKDYEYLKSKNYDIKMGIDFKNSHLIPLENFSPDIVFYSCPYLNYDNTELTNLFLNINYLTCYITYSLNNINIYDYNYNNKYINTSWKNFVTTKIDYYEFIDYSVHYGFNCVLSGYPKFDSYMEDLTKYKLPQKLDNGKPIVIYAPHHSVRYKFTTINLSTFHIYYKYFFDLAKNNKDINFVFKPHPNLLSSIKKYDDGCGMTQEEYLNYFDAWNNLPNGLCVTSGDYINLFRKSSLLITDCCSFISEYLPSKNPCIYLVNPERDKDTYMQSFSCIGKNILDTYYLAYNEQEIQTYFENIIQNNADPKKYDRIKILEENFINIGSAGKFITEYLKNLLTDNSDCKKPIIINDKEYWNEFYNKNSLPFEKSDFAEFVLNNYIEKGKSLIEMGCGNGRDSIYFSKNGVKVIGVDQAENEINFLNSKFKNDNIEFLCGDFTNLNSKNSFDYVYSRFTIHSIPEDGEDRLLNWAFSNLHIGGVFS